MTLRKHSFDYVRKRKEMFVYKFEMDRQKTCVYLLRTLQVAQTHALQQQQAAVDVAVVIRVV